jgi:outer membrane protein assembly factor BamB
VDGQTVIYAAKGRGTKAIKIGKQGNTFITKELWSNPELGTQYNTPVLKDGLLFGLSDSGYLFCINAESGKTAWTDETQRDRNGFGAIVDAGSCLMALPSSSELIVYKPSKNQYQELAKIKVADTPIYSHPVIAGNRIFIKDQESVALLTIQ